MGKVMTHWSCVVQSSDWTGLPENMHSVRLLPFIKVWRGYDYMRDDGREYWFVGILPKIVLVEGEFCYRIRLKFPTGKVRKNTD